MKSKLFLSLFLALLISCSKENTAPALQYSAKTQMLLAVNWKLSNAEISPAFDFSGQGNPTSDAFTHLAPCIKDDVLNFEDEGKLMIEDGFYKCHPANVEHRIAEWNFNPDETQLSFEGQTYRLIKITENSLVLSYIVNSNGVDYTRTYYYSPN